jgi:hypothetical protein
MVLLMFMAVHATLEAMDQRDRFIDEVLGRLNREVAGLGNDLRELVGVAVRESEKQIRSKRGQRF